MLCYVSALWVLVLGTDCVLCSRCFVFCTLRTGLWFCVLALFSVLCALCSGSGSGSTLLISSLCCVVRALDFVHFALCSELWQWTLGSVLCDLFWLCTLDLGSQICALCSVLYSLHTLLFALYSVLCALVSGLVLLALDLGSLSVLSIWAVNSVSVLSVLDLCSVLCALGSVLWDLDVGTVSEYGSGLCTLCTVFCLYPLFSLLFTLSSGF